MRTFKDYRTILNLYKNGLNKCQISRKTNIPRSTIRCIIKKYNGDVSKLAKEEVSKTSGINIPYGFESHHRYQYLYLLGMYLGDGYINKEPRCYRMRIFLDIKYPLIINDVVNAVKILLPHNKVRTYKRKNENCVEIISFSKLWSKFIPQWAGGRKHKRKITLKQWQKSIIKDYPWLFLKGLIHSDGSRDLNAYYKNKEYPRYQFHNRSQDIQNMFKWCCREVGIHYTVSNNKEITSIARRKDVQILDKKIGNKIESVDKEEKYANI